MRNLIERARIAVRDWLNAPARQLAAAEDLANMQAQFHAGRMNRGETMRFFAALSDHGIVRARRRMPYSTHGYTCTCGAADCKCLVLRDVVSPQNAVA